MQRVRAAVALVANPDLLVLDEPTVAMDVEGRHQFWTFMREVAASGKTVIFATHYLEEADAYADRIVLMARGRIVADGPTNEIKATVGLRSIRAVLPGAVMDRAEPAARRRRRGDPRRGHRAQLHRLRPGHPGPAEPVPGRPQHRDQPGPGWKRPSWR